MRRDGSHGLGARPPPHTHTYTQGLFCSLPSRSIERVVAFGMGTKQLGEADRAAIFRGTWMAAVASLNLEVRTPGLDIDWKQHSKAEQAVMRAEPVAVRPLESQGRAVRGSAGQGRAVRGSAGQGLVVQ